MVKLIQHDIYKYCMVLQAPAVVQHPCHTVAHRTRARSPTATASSCPTKYRDVVPRHNHKHRVSQPAFTNSYQSQRSSFANASTFSKVQT